MPNHHHLGLTRNQPDGQENVDVWHSDTGLVAEYLRVLQGGPCGNNDKPDHAGWRRFHASRARSSQSDDFAMNSLQPFTCVLKGRGSELSVLRLVVHHEVARLPEALVMIHADAIKVGEGPYCLTLKNEVTGASIEGLDASAWYVNEATRIPTSIAGDKDRWLLRLGVKISQRLPMRAFVAEAQSAQDILREMCETRGQLQVAWAGPTFEHRLGTIVSFQETLEVFLRRFSASIGCWFVYAGKAGMRFTQQGLGNLANDSPCLVRSAAVTTLAAPPEVRTFWSMNREPVQHDSEAAELPHAYEVVQATEIELPEAMSHWTRPTEWALHHGLSDSAAHFALRAGQTVGAQGRSALAVLHVWSAAETGISDPICLRTAMEGMVPGLLAPDLAHYVAADANYVTLTLSVEQATTLRRPDSTLLLANNNLHAVAQSLSSRLGLGVGDWQPPTLKIAIGMVPATVTALDGKTKQVLKENDYAAIPSIQSPALRSARLRVRFDWHPQAIEVPYASPWSGAGGSVFFPPRSGDRVLIQFVNGDLSSPVVVAALSPEKAPMRDTFQSPGEPFHAYQPQGISARDGLVFETTESGDLVLYAHQGNLVLRARDKVVMQGKVLDQSFARKTNSGTIYDREKKQ